MANQPNRPTLSLNTPDVRVPDAAPAAAEGSEAIVPSGVGVTAGDLEELRAQNADLAEQNRQLHADFEQLMGEIRAQRAAAPRAPDAHLTNPRRTDSEPIDGEIPLFNENEPHGTVTGDSEVGFVQNGHQFSRDKSYLATERHRGVARPFNPRLVGIVRPRKPAAESLN
jgi:hypothetical protein